MRRQALLVAVWGSLLSTGLGSFLLLTWGALSDTDKTKPGTLAPEGPSWLWQVGFLLIAAGLPMTWAMFTGRAPMPVWPSARWGRAGMVLIALGGAAWGGVLAYMRRAHERQVLKGAVVAVASPLLVIVAWRRHRRSTGSD